MTIDAVDTIAGLDAPITYGESVLIAGTVVQAGITGHDPTPAVAQQNVSLQRRVAGGTIGTLTYAFDGAAGTLTITSSNALDTSTVGWQVRGR